MNTNSSGNPSNQNKFEKRGISVSRINEERMVHALSSLIEMDIIVNLENGNKIKGVFHAFDPTSRGNNRAIDIALTTRAIANEVRWKKHCNVRPMIVNGSEYHYISAHGTNKSIITNKNDIPNAHIRKICSNNKFKTDSEITSAKEFKSSEQLLEWRSSEPVDDSQLYELDNAESVEWDQFETNNREYGVVTTYDEELYTTPLDINSIPENVAERADALAAEIMQNNGEGSYSHLENSLEDEEYSNQNSDQYQASSVHKGTKDSKRRDKINQITKVKPKVLLSQHYSIEKTNEKCQVNATKINELIGKQDNDLSNNSSNVTKSKFMDKHYQQIGVNALNLEPASVRISNIARSAVSSERKPGKNSTDNNKNQDNDQSSIGAPQKLEERNNQSSQTIVNYDNRDSKNISETTTKKTFKFNPNASTFTPNSNNDNFVTAELVTANRISTIPFTSSMESVPQIQPNSKIEFKPFTTMQQYPRLDMRGFRSIDNKDLFDNSHEERWGINSEHSYRDILGDLTSLKVTGNQFPIRQTQPMVPQAKMAAVMIPQHSRLTYPTYQIGGLPIGMMPYGTQLSPQFFNGFRYNSPIMQNQVVTRRSATTNNTQNFATLNAATNDMLITKGKSSEIKNEELNNVRTSSGS